MLDNIFNYNTFLIRRKMVGELHPSNRLDQSKPVIGLLVPLETAISECVRWSGQDISRSEFSRYLTDSGVEVFNTVDDFCKVKTGSQERMPRKTKRLLEIVDELNVSKERVEFSSGRKAFIIAGKNGCVHEDESNPLLMHVHVSGRSKRHWSAIKRKLSFMKLLKNESKGGHFIFDKVPDAEQAAAIRNMVGMSKCHTITPEHKEALRNHAAVIRENIGASSLQLA